MLPQSSSYPSRKGIRLVSRNSYSEDRRTAAVYITVEDDWMACSPPVVFRLCIHRDLPGPEVKTGLSLDSALPLASGGLCSIALFIQREESNAESGFLCVFACLVDQIKENEVGRACGTHGRGEKNVQSFGWRARRKEITWKTDA
jgi:hypothetical protein